jgi:micrococcal nuclease
MTLNRRGLKFWLALLAAILIAAAGKAGLTDDPSRFVEKNDPGLYYVDHFVDGDTVAVDMNGHVESVRFIGIDTPETHKPDTPVQCYGPEASAYTRKLIGSGKVRLVSDPQSTDRDRYDRLLRYVYLQDGTLVNRRLVEQGYAFYYPYFPFDKSADFSSVQKTAKAAGKGLWGKCRPEATDRGGYVSNPQGS